MAKSSKHRLLYYIDDKQPILDIDKLREELAKVKVYEIPFEELLEVEQYGVKYDFRDPRFKLEKVVFNRGDFYFLIFIRDNVIYSAKIYGYPTEYVPKIISKIKFNDDDFDDSLY